MAACSVDRVSEEDLIDELTREGVHVALMPFVLPGAYFRHERLVVIDSRRPPIEQRCVLAHELVHVRRGDEGPQCQAVEALVDEKAALLLIRPAEYVVAESLVGPCPAALAGELDVTSRIVEAYQRVLDRAGDPRDILQIWQRAHRSR